MADGTLAYLPLGPRWGRLQCSPDSLAGFGKPSSKGRKRTRETEVEEIGRGGEEKGEGRDYHRP